MDTGFLARKRQHSSPRPHPIIQMYLLSSIILKRSLPSAAFRPTRLSRVRTAFQATSRPQFLSLDDVSDREIPTVGMQDDAMDYNYSQDDSMDALQRQNPEEFGKATVRLPEATDKEVHGILNEIQPHLQNDPMQQDDVSIKLDVPAQNKGYQAQSRQSQAMAAAPSPKPTKPVIKDDIFLDLEATETYSDVTAPRASINNNKAATQAPVSPPPAKSKVPIQDDIFVNLDADKSSDVAPKATSPQQPSTTSSNSFKATARAPVSAVLPQVKPQPKSNVPIQDDIFVGLNPPPPPVSTSTPVEDAELLAAQRDNIQAKIYEATGQEFNINSPTQVSKILFDGNKQSTSKAVLEAIASNSNAPHRELADLILTYRQLTRSKQRTERKQAAKEKRQNTEPTLDLDDDPLILVDASAYIFRAYYSMPPIHRGDGMPTGAVLGFCNMLHRLCLQDKEPRLVLVFDAPGPNFRHALYPDYKANREAPPMDLLPQFSLIRNQMATAYGLPCMEAPGMEADDVIASLAHQAKECGLRTEILSGDKDLMQLVDDQVCMIDPVNLNRILVDDVVDKWGVEPGLLGDVLALAGDTADNVPGVPGIGPKTAALLLQQFETLANLLENTDQVKQAGRRKKLEEFKTQARLSRKLVELDRTVRLTFPDGVSDVTELRMQPVDSQRLLSFCDEMGFRDLKNRLQSRIEGVERQRRQKKTPRPKATIPKPEEFADVPF